MLNALGFSESRVFWSEGRPSEGGRIAIMSASISDIESLESGKEVNCMEETPKDFCLRSRVHEYGGGASLISMNSGVWGVDFKSQQVHWISEENLEQSLLLHLIVDSQTFALTKSVIASYVSEKHTVKMVLRLKMSLYH